MEIVRHELHKLLIKQKGLLLIILFLGISIITQVLLFNNPKTNMSTMDQEHYAEYMSFFSGELTPQKEEYFLSEQSKINTAIEAKALIDSDLVSGEISSDDEYLNRYRKIEAILNKEPVFNEIKSKYEYVAEAPSNRFFVSNDGLPPLLSNDKLDYVLAVLILILTVLFFTNESTSGMLEIMRTTANGGKKSAVCKFFVILVLTVMLTIIFTMLKLLIFSLSYGLENITYPIQSLSYFGSSKFDISIIGTFFISIGFKCIGFCSFSAIAVLMAVAFKKVLLSFFIPIALLLVQEFLFTNNTLQYLLPTPAGLMRGIGYLRGEAFETINKGLTTQKLIKVFDDISVGQILFVILAAIITMAISIAVTLRCYDNKRVKPSFNSKRKNIIAVMLAVLFLGGCSNASPALDINRVHSQNIGQNFSFVQNSESIFSNEGTVLMQDKLSEKQTKLIRNPFVHVQDDKNITAMYTYGNSVYYLKSNAADCVINEISLDTYEETEIFKTENMPKQVFLNAGYARDIGG